MFTMKQKIVTALALILALAGQLNAWFTRVEVMGFSAEKISILLFLPLFVVVVWAMGRRAK